MVLIKQDKNYMCTLLKITHMDKLEIAHTAHGRRARGQWGGPWGLVMAGELGVLFGFTLVTRQAAGHEVVIIVYVVPTAGRIVS